MKHVAIPLAALGAIIAVAGCRMGPNYKRPAITNNPATFRGITAPDIQQSPGDAPLGTQKWQAVFTDPVLQELIEEAIKNNYDMKIAADHVLEQQAQLGITRAAQFPTLSLGGTFTASGGNNTSGSTSTTNSGTSSTSNGGTSSSSTTGNHQYGGITASAAWNLDFWGLYRRETEAQRAYVRATVWAQQTTYSTLVEDVATDYYDLRTLDAELEITKQTRDARHRTLDLTKTLQRGGNDTQVDVKQAEEQLYAAEANIPDYQRQIEQEENQLALLLGRNPGPIARGWSIAVTPHPVGVPAGLPSELLERRPDIRRAEELLVQANANIGAAKAQLFPQFSLSGEGGTTSSQLKGLVDAKNFYYYAYGSVSQQIFDGGKLRNNLRYYRAEDQESIDTYQQTIAGALRDVSNALIAYAKTREYREKQEAQVASAAEAVRLAVILYKGRSTSYLQVLTSDETLYSAQLSLATAQQQEALSMVTLYNVLGGGW
jgi:multidrug efflux system outer membrane protein